VVKVPYPNCYRCPYKKGDICCNYCIDFIEKEVFNNICPPEDTACFLFEPIESFAGEVVPPDDFLPQLKAICDRHGILLVADEVKTGFGRTGRMFAVEHSNVIPDVIILGKPIAGGLPLSAVVGRREVIDAERVSHAHSGSGHPVSCAAGIATMQVIKEEKLVNNAAKLGKYLKRRLEEMMDRYPLIGDVRGRGMMIGVELVKDTRTKAPAAEEALKLSYRAWQLGLVLLVVGTFANVLEITPPLTISREQIDEGMAILDKSFLDLQNGRIPDSVLESASAFL
jgi:4-aminobutyrate aminotransferase